MFRLDLLGPAGISTPDGFVPLGEGSPFAYVILASLASTPQKVTVDALIERLWPEGVRVPPADPASVVARYVEEARDLLGEGGRAAIRTIRRSPAGYQLDRPGATGKAIGATLETDIDEFRRSSRKREALALVRGDLLASVDEEWSPWLAQRREWHRKLFARSVANLTGWPPEQADAVIDEFVQAPGGTLLETVERELAKPRLRPPPRARRRPARTVSRRLRSLGEGRRVPLGRGGLAIAALFAVALVGLALKPWGGPGAPRVQLDLVADQGTATVQLGADVANAISPGCGCKDPRFGEHPWFGMSIPSHGFRLTGTMSRAPTVDGKSWQITALSPGLSAVNWYSGSTSSIHMSASLTRGGKRLWSYAGRAGYVDLVTDQPVTVVHGTPYPYAALIPAAGGATTVTSRQGPSPQLGGSLDVTTRTPARHFNENGGNEPENTTETQRGPMIDLLGPVVTLRTKADHNTHLYAGTVEFFDLPIHRGELLTVTIRTPFAVRLLPHPASKSKVYSPKPEPLDKEEYERAKKKQDLELTELLEDPTIRIVDGKPTPSYTVTMRHVVVPGASAWERFSRQATAGESLAPMLRPIADDVLHGDPRGEYYLPPVPETIEIGVFGPIAGLTSTAVRGRVTTSAGSRPVILGQRLEVRSSEGLDAGKYRMTPLFSAGIPTDTSILAGDATVALDGTAVR